VSDAPASAAPTTPIPDTPALDPARQAFERGDFAETRRLARLQAASGDEPTRAAAKVLLERLQFDPAIMWLTAACVIFFALITLLR